MEFPIDKDPFSMPTNKRFDRDDLSVAGLIEGNALMRLLYIHASPPAEIASNDRLCKLFHYADVLRSFGYDRDELSDVLGEVCINSSLEDLEPECERIVSLLYRSEGNLEEMDRLRRNGDDDDAYPF